MGTKTSGAQAMTDEQYAFGKAVLKHLRGELEVKEQEIKARLEGQYVATGGAVKELPLSIGGMQVGKVSASESVSTEVYDAEVLFRWMSAAGRTETRALLDQDVLSAHPDAWDAVVGLVLEVCPEALVTREYVPDNWMDRHLYAAAEDGSVADCDGGEVVPGVRRVTRVTSRVTGCTADKVRAVLSAGASLDSGFLLGPSGA